MGFMALVTAMLLCARSQNSVLSMSVRRVHVCCGDMIVLSSMSTSFDLLLESAASLKYNFVKTVFKNSNGIHSTKYGNHIKNIKFKCCYRTIDNVFGYFE